MSARRMVIFLLSPRVIDFDTFLPTALALKAARPHWTFRFVTFATANYRFIQANPTLMAGLADCGTLYLLGGDGYRTVFARYARRVTALVILSAWILRWPRPVLFLARPFTSWPYDLLRLLAWARRGLGILLWKSRSPDHVHHIVWQNRDKPAYQRPSFLAHALGHNLDGLVYYHEDQRDNVGLSDRYGRIDNVPWRRIGLPHLFPEWRQLLEKETARERVRLQASGISGDAEIYAMFAAKPWSAKNLRSADAIERVFRQALLTLCRLRPKAIVLIRPHPLAVDEPYVKQAMTDAGPGRTQLTFAHPEVLLTLARRAIFNNPTNIMFSCFSGHFIDCSDYADPYYAEFGEVSLADGYGPVFVNPRATDFETRFAQALTDDGLFEKPEVRRISNALIASNPAAIGPLLGLLEPTESTVAL